MPQAAPLPWSEIRERAHTFAHEYRDAVQEDEEAQSFWNDFFDVFGRRRRGLARFEYRVRRRAVTLPGGLVNAQATDLGRGKIDLFWPGNLLAESKTRHLDLDAAYAQALEYIGGLPEHERPQYVFTSDFARLRFYDLRGKTVYPQVDDCKEISVAELGKNVRLFGFMAGYDQRTYQEQDPVNRKAAERMGKLHDQLEDSGYKGADLERYLVRLLFCLFAEDTDIFPRASFMDLVSRHSGHRGQQLGPLLHQLFQVLDTPEDQRSEHLPEYLREFPYVNGDLFKGGLLVADFSETMRDLLLKATTLDWGQVSPAIFGSLFQSVMEEKERRVKGAHYTSEANILKVIKPLFLKDLRAELNRLSTQVATPQRANRLRELQNRLAELCILDPACGCGNFLVVAYRELRLLELDLLSLLYPSQGGTQFPLGVETAVRLSVEQMFGIELDEFAARIAEVALWLVDHQMNQRISERFGHYMARIPLRQRAHIRHGNALTTSWDDVLPRERATYVVGNPPFVGKRYQTPAQKDNMAYVFQNLRGASKLDFVAAWFWKAAQYIQGTNIGVALVSTNSITQGEQVSLLWGALINRFGMKINFAHQTFKWRNEGKKNATVHCVIIGFGLHDTATKRLFIYDSPTSLPQEIAVSRLNPYLVDAPILLLPSRRQPLSGAPPIAFGSMPNDGGLLSDINRDEILAREPNLADYIRPILGSDEFINNEARWCFWLANVEPRIVRKSEILKQIGESIKVKRSKSPRDATRLLADNPLLFGENRQPTSRYLLVPGVSSENRQYVPMDFREANVIANNLVFTIQNAKLYHFGILTSRMHMAWMRYTCGRLESRYRYSKDIVYNNFPWPDAPTNATQEVISAAAQDVLDARAAHPSSNLADLYDPVSMPADLRTAHQHLDKLVDRLYQRKAFKHDTERVQILFERYDDLSSPLAPSPAPPAPLKPRRRRDT